MFFMDLLHWTMKPTWTSEMSGVTHPRI
jgi:hypothetical protein